MTEVTAYENGELLDRREFATLKQALEWIERMGTEGNVSYHIR